MRNSHVSFTVTSFFTPKLSLKKIPGPRAGGRGLRWGCLVALRLFSASEWWQSCARPLGGSNQLQHCLGVRQASAFLITLHCLSVLWGGKRQREGRRGWGRLSLSPAKCLQVSESTGGGQECTHHLQKGQEQSKERSGADLGYTFWFFCFQVSKSQLQAIKVPFKIQLPLEPHGSFANGSWCGKMLINSARKRKIEISFLPLKIG